MKLIDRYREHLEGVTGDERKALVRLWHKTARYYLVLRSITSDPLPKFLPDKDGITSMPCDLHGIPRFMNHSTQELAQLYRVTRPRSYAK